ncbi:tyrosine-type recombinase/integrase [Natronomonas pharaonis]|uniref:tyrosine-type recombinase/integrase n=1 Tax=Natronomonas pharaonis TaxID=2257 RepID=UPI001E3FDE62|nr:site-specific integrase [Natronomonas pharaonis]
MKLFVEWCEEVGLETVSDIQPLDIDEYHDIRAEAVAPVTLEGEMATLQEYLRYLEGLDAVADDLSEAVHVPNLDASQRSNDVKLSTPEAMAMLQYFRETPAVRASRKHVFLELVWFTGARQSGLRALDLRDVHLDDAFVWFKHRPSEGTGLKNNLDGERPVSLPSGVVDVLREYIHENRNSETDVHGRAPLFTTLQGRPSGDSVRKWCYLATLPCLHSDCPHGKDRESCDWTGYKYASKCPSTRSPHRIRTGSITYQLNIGFPTEVVANRVNASPKTIRDHYDKADRQERRRRQRRRMESDRRGYVQQMDFDYENDIGSDD